MHLEPSLDESIAILEECFTSGSDVEASKRIIRLLLLENEATKKALRPVLSKQLFKPNSARVQKSILLLLRSFGADSVDFPALQKCIGSKDNIEYLAWNIMAKNAQKEIDRAYISNTRDIWREGLNDGDPQIRLAAIGLLEIANEEVDLVDISRMLLDQNEQVRRRAITGLSANKQSTQICRDKISEFFKLCTECSDLSRRHFELGLMISMCDKNGTSFLDSAPILLMLQKIKTGSHDLMYEIMLMIAYQLVGLCGENAADMFPELKLSFLKTQDFSALRACLFMAARVPSLTQEALTLVDYAVTNAKCESNANQALNDLYILGDAARPYIPRLLEIFKDTSLGFTRFAAAEALAKLLNKNENIQEIECLLSHLNDSNLVVVQGACRALGTIFQGDSQTDARIPEAIALLAKHSDKRVQQVSRLSYKQVTGHELLLERVSNPEELKKLFAGLNDPDPFVVKEKLYFLSQLPESTASTELADYTDYMPLIWDIVFNTPAKFSAMEKFIDGVSRIQTLAMKVFPLFGSLAEGYIPQLMDAVLKIAKEGTMNELNQAIVSALALIGKNSEEVLALFRNELLNDSGNHWTAPLMLMGDAGWSTLIQILELKTAQLNELPAESNELSEKIAATQECIAGLLSGQPGRSHDAIPALIEIVVNRAKQSRTVHWCGGRVSNNRITAASALMMIAANDSRVLDLIKRLSDDGSEKELYDLFCWLRENAKQRENVIEPTADAKELANRLLYAVCGNEVAELRSLLAAGADPNASFDEQGMQGDTLLIQAVRGLRLDFVRALVEAGADVNAQGMHGSTALQVACDFDSLEILLYLIENGAHDQNCVPLVYASALGKFELALGLILYGADPNEQFNQQTALASAVRNRNQRLADELLLAGALPAQGTRKQ